MINYNVNNLIDKTLKRFYKTYALTLDTDDFVNPKTNHIISKFIDKNLKQKLKEICKEDKKYQQQIKKQQKQLIKQQKQENKKPNKFLVLVKSLFCKRVVKDKETDKSVSDYGRPLTTDSE